MLHALSTLHELFWQLLVQEQLQEVDERLEEMQRQLAQLQLDKVSAGGLNFRPGAVCNPLLCVACWRCGAFETAALCGLL